LLRLAVPLLPEGLHAWLPVLLVLLLGNILWVGLVTVNQKRLDLMFGNSSVMHMGYIFLAVAALAADGGPGGNDVAVSAAVLLMFAHGISIAMLFALGERIERAAGTLEFVELGGLGKSAPRLAFLFGIAGMATLGLPGLANFAGELLVFVAAFRNYHAADGFGPLQVATVAALWGVVLSAVFILRACRAVFHGPESGAFHAVEDLSPAERAAPVLLAGCLLAVGLYPNLLLQLLR
jgi:NADH-quinone oxidoreductase subunit M